MLKKGFILVVVIAFIHVVYGKVTVAAQDASGVLNQNSTVTCLYVITTGTFLSAAWYNGPSTGDVANELVHSITNPTNGRYSIDVTQPSIATLTITDTRLSDEGDYSCLVNSDNGRNESDTASLVVEYIRNVTIDISSTEKSFFTLICSVKGNPGPQLNLYHNGSTVMEGTESTEMETNLLYNRTLVSERDDGEYYCKASNSAGTVMSYTRMLDYSKPYFYLAEEMVVSPLEYVVIELDRMSANPPDVTYLWTDNNPDIDDTDKKPETFSFNASDVHETTYVISVNVTNVIGSHLDSIKVIVSNPCFCNPCENGAICGVIDKHNYYCTCTDDYKGENCSYCIYDDGVCCNLSKGDYIESDGNGTCWCISGNCRKINNNTGCSENIDYCSSNPCEHGTCMSSYCSYTCICEPGYCGSHCEINPCDSNPCESWQNCSISTQECIDGPGYTCTPGDPCDSSPCDSGQNCSFIIQEDNISFKCTPALPTDQPITTDDFSTQGYSTNTTNSSNSTNGENGGNNNNRNNYRMAAILGGSLGGASFITILGITIYCCGYKIRVKVIEGRVEEGKDAVIPLRTTGQISKASITWYKSDQNGKNEGGGMLVSSDQPKKDRFMITKAGLAISSVKRSDAGYYGCTITAKNEVAIGFAELKVIPDNKNGSKESSCLMEEPTGAGSEVIEMKQGKEGLSRYQAPGGDLYTQVDLKHKKPEKETRPAQVDKNVEGLMYADLDLTRNLPKDQKDTIHHPEPETTYASIQQQHSTKI